MDWNDVRLVLAVGRAGSLAGAARRLGVNYSTAFRRLNALEQRAGARLFDRLPTGYVATEAGDAVLRAGERMDEEATALSRELLGKDLHLRGKIRVTAPEGVAVRLLTPLLTAFGRRHPEIQLELVVTSGTLSLARREADVAVRATRKPPDRYLGHRICKFRFGAYASRGYLDRHAGRPLEQLAWVVTDDGFDLFPPSLWKSRTARPNVVFVSESAQAAVEAARGGLGVCPLPCFLGDDEPDLVRVTPLPEELTLELWVLIHPDLRTTTRVQSLVEWLRRGLSRRSALLEGTEARAEPTDLGRDGPSS